eukprot:scaffold121655_cov20-Tisochrysis_lutea.AAC.1
MQASVMHRPRQPDLLLLACKLWLQALRNSSPEASSKEYCFAMAKAFESRRLKASLGPLSWGKDAAHICRPHDLGARTLSISVP